MVRVAARLDPPTFVSAVRCCSVQTTALCSGLPFQNSAYVSFNKLIVSPNISSVITRRRSVVCASLAQGEALEVQPSVIQEDGNIKKKLYVGNLPWTYSVAEIKELFGFCGTVEDVEIIKQKDGRGRRFAFVTMSSGDEAQSVLEKFDSYEILGRVIRIYFAKRFKKPPPKADPDAVIVGETRHELYASNLAWKVRGSRLREFFSTFEPVSCRVVFDSTSGKSAGYGFVSFATREDAEAALSALHGKELMGRPLRLRLNESRNEEATT